MRIIQHNTLNFLFKLDHYKSQKNHNNLTLSSKIYLISNSPSFINSAKTSKLHELKNFNTHSSTSLRSDFQYLTFNLFNLFFTGVGVEIPKPIIKLQTLHNPINQVNTYKFTNYLSRHGNFLKSLTQVNLAWNAYINIFTSKTNFSHKWLVITLLLTKLNVWSFFTNQQGNNNTTLKNILTSFIKKTQPIFTLYTYKINKAVYKNTRGKSGKFMFVWKYVPVYKRLFIVSTWLLKELRVLPYREIKTRLTKLMFNMVRTPTQTWNYRIKTFSHNYVYRSCRKTLATTYISTKS